MLTVDFDRFPVSQGDLVLDLGCGAGRHAFALARRGANVVALDMNAQELGELTATFESISDEAQTPPGAMASAVRGNAYALPFADAMFDRIVAAEILEHLREDRDAMSELARVLKPGGLIAVSVPRWLPEKVCWALSDEYHEVEGGHVRVYRGNVLRDRLVAAGLEPLGDHHAHGLHSPYWWIKCVVGVTNDEHRLVKAYHRLLVWDMMKAPALTRLTERALNPIIGKSLVVYLRKPEHVYASA